MYHEELTRKGGLGGLVFSSVGGIIAIIISFTFIHISGGSYAGYDEGFVDIFSLVETYNYLMALPVFGIMAIILGAIGYLTQKKQVAYVLPFFGIMILLIPFLFALQFAADSVLSITEVFYYTETVDMGAAGTLNIMWFFFGGFFCLIAGILIILGGKSLISYINPEYVGKGTKLEEAIKAKEMASPDYVDKEQVEQIRQERIARREKEEEEKRQRKEEREYSTTCWVEIEAPASILLGSTEEITANIINDSEVEVKSIEFDLTDLEHYFTITGSLKFNNVAPGEETAGVIKIKPKVDEEGIFPILIEIKLDDETIERRFSIRIEGKESY
ncbi:MAG: hypothetical protein AYK23_02245 [Candidatus Proteinoplasmatales archaeon SG8-5]|nr:MAG: hypothetical protein AYK23_02245 [Candidatus Proteinoplasmatales archaeon SG8-5]